MHLVSEIFKLVSVVTKGDGKLRALQILFWPCQASDNQCLYSWSLPFSGLTDFTAASCIIQHKAGPNEIDLKDLLKRKTTTEK